MHELFRGLGTHALDDSPEQLAKAENQVRQMPHHGFVHGPHATPKPCESYSSALVPSDSLVPALEHLVLRYGFERMCGRVRAADIPVLDLEENTDQATELIAGELERALADDGAEAIILGCAGMVELSSTLTKRYRIPVIEGVGAAVKLVEGLATLGIPTSPRGGYAPPRQKTYSGALAPYSPGITP